MTVWYFDAEERAEAKKKFRSLTGMVLLYVFTRENLIHFDIFKVGDRLGITL